MFNFMKKWFCTLPDHDAKVRYYGMNVLGYECGCCGYEWYEPRVRAIPSLKIVKQNRKENNGNSQKLKDISSFKGKK